MRRVVAVARILGHEKWEAVQLCTRAVITCFQPEGGCPEGVYGDASGSHRLQVDPPSSGS